MDALKIKTASFTIKTQAPSLRSFHIPNATLIEKDDVPKDKQRLFNRLIKHQYDADKYRVDTRISEDVDRQLNEGIIWGMCFQLDLTNRQTERATAWFESLDRQALGIQTELVAFGVCMHVVAVDVDESKMPVRAYHPFRKDENNDEWFLRVSKNLMRFHGVDENRLVSIYQKLRRHLPT